MNIWYSTRTKDILVNLDVSEAKHLDAWFAMMIAMGQVTPEVRRFYEGLKVALLDVPKAGA